MHGLGSLSLWDRGPSHRVHELILAMFWRLGTERLG